MNFEGRLLERGGPGYEDARRGAVWNALTPDRYPELILLAANESDCVGAVRLARERGLKLSVRSGGHSWAGNHLRDGGFLLDLSDLREVEIDPEAMRATAQPGCRGNDLDAELEKRNLFFPVGHCPGVAIGGYLLQGGLRLERPRPRPGLPKGPGGDVPRVDGAAVKDAMPFEEPLPGEREYLAELLGRAVTTPRYETIAAIEASPFDPADALAREEADRLCDPAPLKVESGWTRLEDMSVQIAVETPMPDLTPEMVEWWFDWHPRRPDRYRVWHPIAHFSNGYVPAETLGAKPSWGVTNFPDEDVGDGRIRICAEFRSPSEFGFSSDYLESDAVGTIICARVGDKRITHTDMAHVFLREAGGLRLRSRFWIGSRVRPRLPGPLSFAERPLESIASRKVVRNLAIPDRVGHGLAVHCAEEYAHLNAILPGLYERFSR